MRHQAPGWENKIFPESKGLRIVEHVQKMRKQIADIGKTFTFRECCPQFVSKGNSQVQAPNHDTKITAILQNFFLHRILDHASCLNKASPHCAYIIWYGYGPKPCNPCDQQNNLRTDAHPQSMVLLALAHSHMWVYIHTNHITNVLLVMFRAFPVARCYHCLGLSTNSRRFSWHVACVTASHPHAWMSEFSWKGTYRFCRKPHKHPSTCSPCVPTRSTESKSTRLQFIISSLFFPLPLFEYLGHMLDISWTMWTRGTQGHLCSPVRPGARKAWQGLPVRREVQASATRLCICLLRTTTKYMQRFDKHQNKDLNSNIGSWLQNCWSNGILFGPWLAFGHILLGPLRAKVHQWALRTARALQNLAFPMVWIASSLWIRFAWWIDSCSSESVVTHSKCSKFNVSRFSFMSVHWQMLWAGGFLQRPRKFKNKFLEEWFLDENMNKHSIPIANQSWVPLKKMLALLNKVSKEKGNVATKTRAHYGRCSNTCLEPSRSQHVTLQFMEVIGPQSDISSAVDPTCAGPWCLLARLWRYTWLWIGVILRHRSATWSVFKVLLRNQPLISLVSNLQSCLKTLI